MQARTLPPGLLIFGTMLLGWLAIALMLAGQAWLLTYFRGAPQPWWPSFGYTLSVCSIWLLLTPVIVRAVGTAEGSGWRWPARLAAYAAGLPIVAALHVLLFAMIFWPVYNDGGRIPTRRAMAERMLVGNFDTNSLFYIGLVALAVGLAAWRLRRAPNETAGWQPLVIREHGRMIQVPLDRVDWIGAAGDYAELHCGERTYLIARSMAALERELPPAQFARIHRARLVRLDRIAEISPLGHGDALVRLIGGTELRLSRRYRANLAMLRSIAPAGPA